MKKERKGGVVMGTWLTNGNTVLVTFFDPNHTQQQHNTTTT